MSFNSTAINLFNESDTYLNLLVYETDERLKVYTDLNENLIAAGLQDINYKVVMVEEIVEIESELYYKINYQNKVKGYFKPNDSVIIVPKVRQQIKFTDEVEFINDLNKHLLIEDVQLISVKSKISYSSYHVIYKGKVYEGIVHKNTLLGFVESKYISYLIKVREEFKIIEETFLFRDSSLTKELSVIKPSKNKFKSEFIIPDEGVLRFRYEGKPYWISLSCTTLTKIPGKFVPVTASDVLLQSLMYQYKDKLRKSHSYYLKLLKQELNKVKGDLE